MPPPKDTKRVLELLYEKLQRQSTQSLSAYLDNVIVDCVPDPKPFGKIREKWQEKRDEALVPAIEFVSGIRDYTGPMNFWFNYSKGHDKTSYLARLLNWMLAFAPRKNMRLYCGAKDAEQAAIVLDAMGKEASLNKWVGERIEFKKMRADSITNGSQLQILTSDAGGNQGKNPDLIVADELTNWDTRDLFDSLYSGVGKRGDRTGRQRCAFVILTNAGVLGSWQDNVRQLAKAFSNDDWYFYEQAEGKPLAGWLAADAIERQCRLMTKTEGDRLWRNRWTDPTEDNGAFSPSDVDACTKEPTRPHVNSDVYFGIDYAGVHDRTALCSMFFDGEVLQVFDVKCWQGSHTSEIKVADVDAWLERQFTIYPNATAVFDKYQMLATIQKFQKDGRKVVTFEYAGGKQNFAMLENLRILLQNRKIRFAADAGMHPYDGSTLVSEFKEVLVKKKTYGLRIDHESGKHDDRVIAVGMAALECIKSCSLLKEPVSQQIFPGTRPTVDSSALLFYGRGNFNSRGHYGLQ
jgi:hypothetical protein